MRVPADRLRWKDQNFWPAVVEKAIHDLACAGRLTRHPQTSLHPKTQPKSHIPKTHILVFGPY